MPIKPMQFKSNNKISTGKFVPSISEMIKPVAVIDIPELKQSIELMLSLNLHLLDLIKEKASEKDIHKILENIRVSSETEGNKK